MALGLTCACYWRFTTVSSPSTAEPTAFAISERSGPHWRARGTETHTEADPDAAALAAAYAYGLAKHHGFVDGNKRTAWVAARLFLADNGQVLTFDPRDAIRIMEGVASGHIDDPAFSRRVLGLDPEDG